MLLADVLRAFVGVGWAVVGCGRRRRCCCHGFVVVAGVAAEATTVGVSALSPRKYVEEQHGSVRGDHFLPLMLL